MKSRLDEFVETAKNFTPPELKAALSKLVDLINASPQRGGFKPLKRNEPETHNVKANSLPANVLIYLHDNLERQKESAKLFNREALAGTFHVANSQVSRAAIQLHRKGLLIVKRVYFPETGKFRNVYELTVEGAFKAQELKEFKG